jgi:hypothetical protein
VTPDERIGAPIFMRLFILYSFRTWRGPDDTSGHGPLSDHVIFHQHCQFAGRQPQLAAQDFDVMLADPRRSPRDAPRRAVIDRRFAGIGEAATEFRMLDRFPETAIVQMRVIEQLLWRADRTPG